MAKRAGPRGERLSRIVRLAAPVLTAALVVACSGREPARHPGKKNQGEPTSPASTKDSSGDTSPVPFDPVVSAVAEMMDQAIAAYEQGDVRGAKKLQQDAYYVEFEGMGMEVAVREYVSAARAFELEELFAEVRDALGFPGSPDKVRRAVKALLLELSKEARRLAKVMPSDAS